MFKKIADRFGQALLKRRRRFQKIFPFLKHFHPAYIFGFILLFVMTMRFVIFPSFVLLEGYIRTTIEEVLGYTLAPYSVEVAFVVLLVATIITVRKKVTRHLKAQPIKGETMQAMIYEAYGEPEVFHETSLKKPKQGRDELLVKIVATAVTTGDINMRGFTYVPHGLQWIARVMLGFKRPKKELIGNVFSGVVEAVGAGVKAFKVGDEVFGMDSSGTGAYAQYKTIAHDKAVVLKPATITHEEAASVPFGAMTALHFLQKAKIEAGQSVLINGASGSVGSAAVQIANDMGAKVTAVCSTTHIETVRALGADEVIDYTQNDIRNGGKTYDVVLNTVVAQGDFEHFKNLLKPKGTYIAIAGGLKDLLRPLWGVLRKQKVIAGMGIETKELLEKIASMLIEGRLVAVVDPQLFTLATLAQAHRHAQSKAKRGNVVVRVA